MCSTRRFWKKFDLIFFFLGLLANIDVFCRNISEHFDPFPPFQANFVVLQNYLIPGNFSNLSFLAGAEQLICRTPPLAAFEPYLKNSSVTKNKPKIMNSNQHHALSTAVLFHSCS